VAILAAGQSRRFGDQDKLLAPLDGKPLGLHVCDTLAPLGFDHRWVIAADPTHPCADGWNHAGFAAVANPQADIGMGTSVALAAQLARGVEADALLICLADMPLVPREHFHAMLDRAQTARTEAVCASSDGASRLPPVLFGRERFLALTGLSGDEGGRALLADAQVLECSPELLVDIDTPEALEHLSQRGLPG